MLLAKNIALGLFLLATVVFGLRLLWLARRQRGLPELQLGTFYLTAGAMGYLPEALVLAGAFPESIASQVLATAQLVMRLGMIAMLTFVVSVFRPGRWPPRVAATGIALLLLLSFWGHPLNLVFSDTAAERKWVYLFWVLRVAIFSWASGEAFIAYSKAKRRLVLGLGDAIVVDRFRVWGLSMAWLALMTSSPIFFTLVALPMNAPIKVLFECVLALLASGYLWLTFFPPAWYSRRWDSASSLEPAAP